MTREMLARAWRAFIMALFMALPLIASSEASHQTIRNWNVDGLNGGVFASGMVMSSPCVLAPESRAQEINLGGTAITSLRRYGDVSVPVDVHIVLDDCPRGIHYQEGEPDLRRGMWLTDQGVARMTIAGEQTADDARFFQLKGTTSGVSLRIEDPAGEILMPSVSDHPFPLNEGRNDLTMKAQLWRNNDPLRGGEWYATVRVDMEYE